MPITTYKTKKGIRYRYRFKYENESYTKGGFNTSKEAKQAEADLKNRLSTSGSVNIMFSDFVNEYMKDMEQRLKEVSFSTKKTIVEKHILPLFPDKKLFEIKALDIRNWQNRINETDYSADFKRTMQQQLSALFNYATSFYELPSNPVKSAGSICAPGNKEMEFWTYDEFKQFISFLSDEQHILIIYTLFYTGMRVGELLALSWGDIDFTHDNMKISINKTKQRVNGRWIVTPPKTKKSERVIAIHNRLGEMLAYWKKLQYKEKKSDFIFRADKSVIKKCIDRTCKQNNLNRIRIHDLRHSHVALLIHLEANIIEIANRLGHNNIQTTMNTYAHLYPDKQKIIADKLAKLTEPIKSDIKVT